MEIFPIFDENTKINENIWYVISGTGESPLMRVGHTITHIKQKLDDKADKGDLYLIGGANPAGYFDDVFKFSLNNLIWTKITNATGLNSSRYEHACFVDSYSNPNTIYIFGGASQETNLNEVNGFDLKTEQWKEIKQNKGTNKPCARTQHTSCVYKNQLVVFGGGKAGSLPVTDQQVHLYDPINNSWSTPNIKGQPPSNRHGHLMINFNDKYVYLHGGMNDQKFYDDLWILDFDAQKWSLVKQHITIHPCARAAHGGMNTENKLYIFGGLDEKANALGDFWSYDVIKSNWSIVKIIGDNPPSRLDYAYCKLKLNYRFNESSNLEEKSQVCDSVETEKELVQKIVTVLNVEELKEDDETEQAQFVLNNEAVKVENIVENKVNNEKNSLLIEAKAENRPEEKIEVSNLEESIKNLKMDTSDWVEKEYFLIHGGMDTEGNIFDDCFIINLS